MIQLDEHTSVKDADEVQAIRPMFIPSPDPIAAPNRRDSIIDQDRCQVLIGGTWWCVERGTGCIARVLSPQS